MNKVTTIIPNPTWAQTLELLHQKGTLRINTSDSDTFKNLLNSMGLKYSTEEEPEKKLTRFTLLKTNNMKRNSICFAYFGDGKFLGWYADTSGSIRPASPKVYIDTPEQRKIIETNFRNKLSKLNVKSDIAEKTGQPGLSLLDNSLNADKANLSQYSVVELRIVECPEYDGPNPDFDREAHEKLVDERRERLKVYLATFGVDWESGPSARRFKLVDEFNEKDPSPRANNWIYCDYKKVKEWASNEPTEFLAFWVVEIKQ
jgi:hypothetical protein